MGMSMLVALALYTMGAKSHGSAVDVVLTNPGKDEVTLTTHVKAGIDHFDSLGVVLTAKSGGATRKLVFTEARNKSVPVEEKIPAGGSVTESVDLQWWAIRAVNGGEPIAPGTYDVEVTWEKEKSKTVVTIEAPKEAACSDAWNSAQRKGTTKPNVQMLGRQVAPKSTTMEIGIHNADAVSHCVAAYVKTHEIQSDWMTVVLDKRSLAFTDAREKSVQILVELPPGATWWQKWDLAEWAKRSRNGGTALPHGHVAATLNYDASSMRDALSIQTSSVVGIELP